MINTVEIPIAYAGPTIYVDSKNDLLNMAFFGIIKRLSDRVVVPMFKLYDQWIKIDDSSITFIWDKKFFYLNENRNLIIPEICKVLDEEGFEYEMHIKDQNDRVAVTVDFKIADEEVFIGFARINNMICTLAELKNHLTAIGITQGFGSYSFNSVTCLTDLAFPKLSAATYNGIRNL